MDIAPLLVELFDRIPALANAAVEDLDADLLSTRPGEDANTVGWLVWHIGRVMDLQIADVTGEDQVWVSGDWARRMGLDPDPSNSGYGHSSDQVDSIKPDGPDVLVDYLEAVQARTIAFLEGLVPEDLDRVVDRRWEPPVTLGVRLISIADDCLQHAGQAAYVRGLLRA